MKVLALGAHPDDVEIFAFGSLLAWREAGAEVAVAIATDGAAGGREPGAALASARAAEAEAAMLGVVPRFLGFPDGALRPDAPLDRALRDLIATEAPDMIVTHAPGDYHADHRALSAAVGLAANFHAPVLHMDTMGGTGFVPTHWVDVTPHWTAKCAAIRAHASQDPERFVALADRMTAFRAGEANGATGTRAEAFRFEPRFPFADIRALLPPAPPVRPLSPRR